MAMDTLEHHAAEGPDIRCRAVRQVLPVLVIKGVRLEQAPEHLGAHELQSAHAGHRPLVLRVREVTRAISSEQDRGRIVSVSAAYIQADGEAQVPQLGAAIISDEDILRLQFKSGYTSDASTKCDSDKDPLP